ncbi:MAG: polyphosphate kinase 2 family protein [Actinomycetia bacterium]|nr:polyphosphate kinase 2 family protein [Actinomycetes bacterium]
MAHHRGPTKGKPAPELPGTFTLGEILRCPPGPVDVERDFDPAATPHFPGKGKDDAPVEYARMQPVLDGLQERLYAHSFTHPDSAQRVLLVLQGMDTSGKGGVIRHAIGMINPQGVSIHAFKAPTAEELRHDFLWRVRRALPGPGQIGIFDRSHYEDVLIGRVDHLAAPDEIEARYDRINAFEREVVAGGARVIKCFLNVSKDAQKARLAARLAPGGVKYWKYNPSDLASRAKWDDYMAAYGVVLERCNQDEAPWYVIPADRKWYRNWAVARLLAEALAGMNLTWPPADFDVEAERARVAQS